ncbi:unnamed protein product [Durusdinium trenchii]|uniref:Uncharacterized protein n=2 Tax=Durusdinium trenchii TaxID=1381693 RepID=A0ABP0N304_9DINO
MARPVLSIMIVAAAAVALLSQSMAFLAGPKEVPRVVVPAAALAPMLVSSAAHAETLDSDWITPTYEDPSSGTSADLGYLLFFTAISIVAIARDTFSKSDSKSLKDAVLGKD